MILISTTTKVIASIVAVSTPTIIGVYCCLPQSIIDKTFIPKFFEAFEKKYIYFLVSKAHLNKGSFYNQTPEDASRSTVVPSTKSADSEQVKQYKKNFKAWKDDADTLNKSAEDLFNDGKKNYKCAIPVVESRESQNNIFKFFDTNCSILQINPEFKSTSDIAKNFKGLTEVKQKADIDYNKMYVLRVNAKISDHFIFFKNLVAEIVEYDTDDTNNSNRILSLGLDNQYSSFNKTWIGKVNKVLVTSKSKTVSTLNPEHKKSCQDSYGFNTECLAFNFVDGDSKREKYRELKIVEKTKLKDNTKYVVKFLSTKFISPTSVKLKKDYTYYQEDTNSTKKQTKKLIDFTYESSMLGFIDMDDSSKNQLFINDTEQATPT